MTTWYDIVKAYSVNPTAFTEALPGIASQVVSYNNLPSDAWREQAYSDNYWRTYAPLEEQFTSKYGDNTSPFGNYVKPLSEWGWDDLTKHYSSNPSGFEYADIAKWIDTYNGMDSGWQNDYQVNGDASNLVSAYISRKSGGNYTPVLSPEDVFAYQPTNDGFGPIAPVLGALSILIPPLAPIAAAVSTADGLATGDYGQALLSAAGGVYSLGGFDGLLGGGSSSIGDYGSYADPGEFAPTSGGFAQGIDDLGQLGYAPQGDSSSLLGNYPDPGEPILSNTDIGSYGSYPDPGEPAPTSGGFAQGIDDLGQLGYPPQPVTEQPGFFDQLSAAIQKDPATALKLGLGASSLLGGAGGLLGGSSENSTPYVEPAIDQNFVNQRGAFGGYGTPHYQDFYSLPDAQALYQQRLSRGTM